MAATFPRSAEEIARRMDARSRERFVRERLTQAPDDGYLLTELALAVLGQGRWGEGFQLYENRRLYPGYEAQNGADLRFPRWRGEPLEGKRFVIRSVEGLGDQIMYARFAKLLQARGADVLWLCKPAMTRLLNCCMGIRAAPMNGVVDLGRVAFGSESSSLAGLFMPPLEAPPADPYIMAPPPRRIAGRSVGVVTRGNPTHVNDSSRSLPPEMAGMLLDLPGAISLQPEDTGAQDLYDTAAIMAGLDLVVTVDTSVAHLAGAMGKPVWVLLPAERTDWRWLEGRSDSPWYPSARLYRQDRPGDWSGVIDRVGRDLVTAVHQIHAASGIGSDISCPTPPSRRRAPPTR